MIILILEEIVFNQIFKKIEILKITKYILYYQKMLKARNI